MNDTITLFCSNHPNVETGLRCNNCEKPICPKCAVLTPTGYRCKECLRSQQKIFETAAWYDPMIAALIAVIVSFFGSYLATIMGFFTIFIAPIVGIIIAEAIRFAVRRRRSVRIYQAATAAAVLGSLPLLLINLIGAFNFGFMANIWDLVWLGFYTFTVGSTILYRLRGIRIG
jgi:hypothetical protein